MLLAIQEAGTFKVTVLQLVRPLLVMLETDCTAAATCITSRQFQS